MAAAASGVSSAAAPAFVITVAPIPPVLSTLTCAAQRRSNSAQWLSTYHAEPEYRPCEWPDQKQSRKPRRQLARSSASTRAHSSMVALAAPLSITPKYQVSWCPDSSTNGAPGVAAGSRSATRIGVCRQPVSTCACSVTTGCSPRRSWSSSMVPSVRDTVHATVVGKAGRVDRPGFPQTGEMHISCKWSCGLMCSWPTAPARRNRSAAAGLAIPSTSAMQPARSPASVSSHRTSRPVRPASGEDRENECVMAVTARSSTSTRAAPGRLM